MNESNDALQEMIEINKRQRDFYERVREERNFDHGGRSVFSRLWSRLRNRLWSFQSDVGMRRVAGVLPLSHLQSLNNTDVLDFGAGSGSDLSMHLAENARSYTAIDLAQTAVDNMNERLGSLGFSNARAVRGDILESALPAQSFDVVYAAAVLHHFKDIEVIARELDRLLRPGGVILS